MALYYIALQGKNNAFPVQPGGMETVIINLLIPCLQCTTGKKEDVREMRAYHVFSGCGWTGYSMLLVLH